MQPEKSRQVMGQGQKVAKQKSQKHPQSCNKEITIQEKKTTEEMVVEEIMY